MQRLGSWLAFLLFQLGLATAAHAGPPSNVLIWSAPDDSLAMRLRAELEAAGFDVLAMAAPPTVSRVSIESAGREHAASTIVRFLPNAGEVQFWSIDRTGAATLRDVLQPATETDEDVSARRAAELVRAAMDQHGGVEGHDGGRLDSRPAGTPAEVEGATRAQSSASVGIGPAVLANPASSASIQALLSGEWRAFEHVGANAFLLVPVSAGRIAAAEGSARVRTFMVGGGARLYLASEGARWRPNVGAGAGVGLIQIDGTANQNFLSRSTDRLTFVAYGTAGLTVALSARVELAAEGRVGVATPSIGVRFAEREVATWGVPWTLGSLSVVLTW